MSEEFRSPHQPDAWPSSPAPPQSTGGNAELDNLEEDLLVQTAELVEQVQKQLADLNRREKTLIGQTGQLEHDRRAFRLEKQEYEQHVRDEEARLQNAQQEHDARRAEFDAEKSAVKDNQGTMAARAAMVP
jgi:septal ring factor EnvC (AmiA/AmiB activator)